MQHVSCRWDVAQRYEHGDKYCSNGVAVSILKIGSARGECIEKIRVHLLEDVSKMYLCYGVANSNRETPGHYGGHAEDLA
jgi:hypothetical protein